MEIRLLELALKGLELERARIEQEIEELSSQLRGKAPKAGAVTVKKSSKRSAAARKAHSEAMRRYWARKKGVAKPARKKPRFSAAQRKAARDRMTAYWAKKKLEQKRSAKASAA